MALSLTMYITMSYYLTILGIGKKQVSNTALRIDFIFVENKNGSFVLETEHVLKILDRANGFYFL